jgi:hypothetical protein
MYKKDRKKPRPKNGVCIEKFVVYSKKPETWSHFMVLVVAAFFSNMIQVANRNGNGNDGTLYMVNKY